MADEQRPERSSDDRDSALWVVVGAALVVAGVFFGARSLGLLPREITDIMRRLAEARTGIGILLVGVAFIIWARSDRGFTAPARGTRLYRSRDEKWLAGVLGGLAGYFGPDVTLLRLAFIALVVLFDVWALVVAYIVMAIVVPLEPETPGAQPAA